MNKNHTLLLTSWYFPHKVIRWEDAVTLVYLHKADAVVTYDEKISSPSVTMGKPAVIRLRKKHRMVQSGVKFSRQNVFTRDGFRCQYCTRRLPVGKLTYDHVIPRKRGGRTEWTNIVTACRPCHLPRRTKPSSRPTGSICSAPRRSLSSTSRAAQNGGNGSCTTARPKEFVPRAFAMPSSSV